MPKRKTPIKHPVKSFRKTDGTIVHNYTRGHGTKPQTHLANPTVKTLSQSNINALTNDISELAATDDDRYNQIIDYASKGSKNDNIRNAAIKVIFEPESFQLKKNYVMKNLNFFLAFHKKAKRDFKYPKYTQFGYKQKFN